MNENKHINPKIITAILSRDMTSTTYKYALLRSVVQCIADHHSHKRPGPDGWEQFPMGILIYYWMLYYFPIVNAPVFIPQMNGESVTGDGKQMAIRPPLKKLGEHYGDLNSDALAAFKLSLDLGTSDPGLQQDLVTAARKIYGSIRNMPMKHLGFSQFREHYSLIRPGESGSIRKVSLYDLIHQAGTFEIRTDLYEVLLELGPVIVGEETILQSWAGYTERAADLNEDASPVDRNEMLDILSQDQQFIRDTSEIRTLVGSQPDLSHCVWSGSKVTMDSMQVDHVIPFSVWYNNDLWNLLPATSTINNRKRDRIPTPDLIDKSRDRILGTWTLYEAHFGDRFPRDAYNGLGYVRDEGGLDQALEALMFKSEYLIEKRGLPAFEG